MYFLFILLVFLFHDAEAENCRQRILSPLHAPSSQDPTAVEAAAASSVAGAQSRWEEQQEEEEDDGGNDYSSNDREADEKKRVRDNEGYQMSIMEQPMPNSGDDGRRMIGDNYSDHVNSPGNFVDVHRSLQAGEAEMAFIMQSLFPYLRQNAPPINPGYNNNGGGYLRPQAANNIQPPTNDNYYSQNVQSSYADSLFGPGDIPIAWRQLVQSTPLAAFNGRWAVIIGRSGSVDRMLSALGVAKWKRQIMEVYQGVTEVTVMEGANMVNMQNLLPRNLVVGATVPLSGQSFIYDERETGQWESRAMFADGRLGQVRSGPRGMMYDVRAIFPSDPQGIYNGPGPLMLFRWSFIPAGNPNVIIVDRWLRRL